MKTTPILLLAGDAGWLPLPQDASVALRASDFLPDAPAVIKAIQSQTQLPGVPGVLIALPSHRCFAARVGTAGLPARQLRHAMPYRFESAVPFAVEDLVLDAHGQGDHRLVVAAHPEPLRVLVHELEDTGVRVCGIAPLALLAAQSADPDAGDSQSTTNETTFTIAEPSALCEAHVQSVSEVQCSMTAAQAGASGATAWRWLPGSTSDVEDSQLAVADTLRLAQATVRRVVAEEDELWINLQRGPLASRHHLDRVRRPLVACLAAGALLLVASIGAMQARSWQYRDAAALHDAQAQSLYVAAFPGEPVPVSMERRLMTRLRGLRGRQGLATSDTRLFDEENTLAVLHDLLARLPDGTRFIITDLRLNGDRIDLDGLARSHSDADTLAATLRRDGRFQVTPPSTENLPAQGVRFSLNLTPQSQPGTTDHSPTAPLAAEQVGTDGRTP